MIEGVISKRQKDPLGVMLLDYLDGRQDAQVEVESSTFAMWTMSGAVMCREYGRMDELERMALSLCSGRILDVGAGSGCHSLHLQEKGLAVEAIDISGGCVRAMRRRGVRQVRHRNLFDLRGESYDTVLMLMNGIGICGTVDGCNLFMQFIKSLLQRGGQVLADSTDLLQLPWERLEEEEDSPYLGETEFVMKYKDSASDPFAWVYLDFATLRHLARYNGLRCQQIMMDGEGRYLARIY